MSNHIDNYLLLPRTNWCSSPSPIISIVTVVYDDAEGLRRTVESVARQTYTDLEYIIIDGGSSDGTVDVIREQENVIDYWLSEPDKGISDAFNKGISQSRGRWINLLNAGDTILESDAIERLVSELPQSNDIRVVTMYEATPRGGRRPKHRPRNDFSLARRARIPHQASFVRRDVYADYGLYRTDLNYRMDLEFWLRVLRHESFRFIPMVYSQYEGGGVSATNHIPMIIEGHKVEAEHLTARELVPAIGRSILSNSVRVPYYWLRQKFGNLRSVASTS